MTNLSTPLESGIILANDEILSVRMIHDLHLNARLAALSACETGVSGADLSDEVVAMPIGLLQAGAAGVTATVWPAADLITALLFVEFYRGLCCARLSPAATLGGAQQWMQDMTQAQKVGVAIWRGSMAAE